MTVNPLSAEREQGEKRGCFRIRQPLWKLGWEGDRDTGARRVAWAGRKALVRLESGRLSVGGQACEAVWAVQHLSKPQLHWSRYGWPTAQGNFYPSASARGPCHVAWPLAPFLEYSYLAFEILLKLPSVAFSGKLTLFFFMPMLHPHIILFFEWRLL